MDRKKTLVKNVFVIALGVFLPKLTNIITLPVVTAGLTRAEYGTYDLISTLVSLLMPIITMQIQSSAFRFLIDSRENGEETRRIVTNTILFGVSAALVSFLILFCTLKQLNFTIRILVCLYFTLDTLISIVRQIIRGLSNNKLYALSSSVQSIVNMALMILTVSFMKQGLAGALFSLIAASFFGLLLLIIKGNIAATVTPSLFSAKFIGSMLRYSWPMIPNQLSSWILNASDRMVITAYIGLEATAVYAAAYKIPSLLTALQSTISFAWQESASLAAKDADREAYYSDMFDSMFNIMSGLLGLLIAATPILFRLLIRGDYTDSYAQIPILFLGMLFSTLSAYLGGIYIAFKKTVNVGITTAFAAGLNLIINLSLIHKIGIYAASISTLASYFIWLLYRMIDVQKFQKVHYNIKKIVLQLMLLTGMCFLCWLNEAVTNILNLSAACIFVYVFNRELIKAAFHICLNKLKKVSSDL